MTEVARGLTLQSGEVVQVLGLGECHKVDVTGTAQDVGPFDGTTTVVRITTKVPICISGIGDATVDDSEFDPGRVEYVKVEPGGTLSVIKQTGAADGVCKITESS